MMTFSWYLILSIVSLLSSLAHSTVWLDCGSSTSFAIELDNNQRAFVYDAEIKINYDRNDLAVYDYPGLDAVNILINNTIIDFSGHIVTENQKLDRNASKTSRIFNLTTAGSARVMKRRSKDVLMGCSLFLSKNRNEEELNMPKRIEEVILQSAGTCAKRYLCQKLGFISLEDLRNGKKNPFDFGSLSVLAENEPNSENKPDTTSGTEKLVDKLIARFVKELKEKNLDKIKIPDLNQNFVIGSGSWWETNIELKTYDGTFEDLTALSRDGNVNMSRPNNSTYVLEGQIDLSRIVGHYNQYKVSIDQTINLTGDITVRVQDGVAFSGAIAIDHIFKPCKIELVQSLRVARLGKISVEITGLDSHDQILSNILTWMAKIWKDDIVKLVEKNLEELAQESMKNYNCN